jgi:hypothetical protein
VNDADREPTFGGDAGREPERRGVRELWRRVERFHEAVFVARWGGSLRRAARQEEDRFLAVLLLASYGIDDPAAYETLELTPHLVQAFHDLHRREGLETFPVHGVCC